MARRRSKGDGGLFQRHDHPSCPPLVTALDGKRVRARHRCRGRWAFHFTVWVDAYGSQAPRGSGTPRRVSGYGPSHEEARAKLQAGLRRRDEGSLVVGSTTVAAWMGYWLAHVAGRSLKEQTLAGYRSKIDTLIVPHLGRHDLTRLRPEHIRGWHDTLRTSGGRGGTVLAETSVRQAHMILRKALQDAVYDGRLAANPAARVKSPATTGGQTRAAFTVEQAAVLLRKAGGHPRWWLAVFYGLRQGEVLGLRWCDVDLEHDQLHVVQSLQIAVDRTPFFGPPKTRKAQRSMPLLPVMRARLEAWAPEAPDPDSLVFHDATGGPIMPWVDSRAWHDLLAAAGLPPLPLHSARHTAASVLEAAGVADRLIAQILGHSQVQTTHGYTHADMQRQADALTAGLSVLAIDA